MNGAEGLSTELLNAYPELAAMAAVAPEPVYLVGGAVRDLLLGRGRTDLDLVVEGDPAALTKALAVEPLAESRFGTVKLRLDGHAVDVAAARWERYQRPGALPTVELGAPIEADLARRDFTLNAMAVPLAEPARLIDPHGGRADLEAGLLRVIHERSFRDDPTRAIRAARYAARFGFTLEKGTERLLREADLGTVSVDRRAAELRRLAAEAMAVKGLELLAGWGLARPRWGPGSAGQAGAGDARDEVGAGIPADRLALARAVDDLLSSPPWSAEADRADAILAAALGPAAGEGALARARPSRPSAGVALARGHDPIELVLARAAGAAWLDDWLAWREVSLDIDGTDLTAAGLSGPAVGKALAAARAAKLDGEAPTRADQLRVALNNPPG